MGFSHDIGVNKTANTLQACCEAGECIYSVQSILDVRIL